MRETKDYVVGFDEGEARHFCKGKRYDGEWVHTVKEDEAAKMTAAEAHEYFNNRKAVNWFAIWTAIEE